MAKNITTIVRAWAFETEDQILEFVPSDGWTVYELN